MSNMADTTRITAPAKYEICLLCGSVGNLLRCVRCKRAYYCSRDHQKKHWGYHKYMCEEISMKKDYNLSKSKNNDWHQSTSKNDDSLKRISSSENGSSDMTNDNEDLLTKSPDFEICDPLISSTTKTGDNDLKYFSADWLDCICDIVKKDMNSHGICVVDKFLGCLRGEECLKEVMKLYESGQFEAGQVIKRVNKPSGNVRGDFITWLNGTEPSCPNIGILIKVLDAVVSKVNKQHNSGKLKEYDLSTRTKAMLACYPGSGTNYVKHVDNPNGDGRCLTCIYYLNKDWDISKHGGLLRVFPSHENKVANIEPKFDRMIFFWSDKRNPHEVQPAFRRRFAITVWYLDSI